MVQAEKAPPLLDVNEVAWRLGTEPRFVRRLIAERRIEFHKLGRHVRISEAALAEFIKAGRVEPLTAAGVRFRARGAALWLTKMGIGVSATLGSGSLVVSRSAIQGQTGVCVPGQIHMSARATPRER